MDLCLNIEKKMPRRKNDPAFTQVIFGSVAGVVGMGIFFFSLYLLMMLKYFITNMLLIIELEILLPLKPRTINK